MFWLNRGSAYNCTGYLTEWTKCTYRTQEPKRVNQLVISDDLQDYECLSKFKFEPNQVRIFEKSIEEAAALRKKEPAPAGTDAKKPLKGMNFSTVGKLNKKIPKLNCCLRDSVAV